MKKHKKKEKSYNKTIEVNNEPEPARDKGYQYIIKYPISNEMNVMAFAEVLKRDTQVIIPTKYGLDYGVVLGSTEEFANACVRPKNSTCDCDIQDIDASVDWIERVATESDLAKFKENEEKIPEAKAFFLEKVNEHKLEMKYINAHFLVGESKLIFFFTSSQRVDFRELVKDLVGKYRTRIELRQLRPREESQLIGGLGVCGRDYCCYCVGLNSHDSVTIKMAKEQNLSLNSVKISGPCGRLLCCLGYEYEQYVDEKKFYPNIGATLKVGPDIMRIIEVNIINSTVKVKSDDSRYITIPYSALYNNPEKNRWYLDENYYQEFINI